MVMNLQDAGHGDAGRLEHIAETVARGRVVYDSDRRYVERKHAELSKGKIRDGVARNMPRPPRQGHAFNNNHQRAADRVGYGLELGHGVGGPSASEMRKTTRPIDYPPQPSSAPPRGYDDTQHSNGVANPTSPEFNSRTTSPGRQPRNVDRSHPSTSTRRGSNIRFKVGITFIILGVLVLAFDAWIIIAWGSQAVFVTGSDLVLLVSIGGIGLILFLSGLVLALVSRR